MHLDRGYDSALTTQRCHSLGVTDIVCAKKKRPVKKKHKGEAKTKKATHPRTALARRTHQLLVLQLRPLCRNTDRFSLQRLGQIALALILTVKLVKWAKRWTD